MKRRSFFKIALGAAGAIALGIKCSEAPQLPSDLRFVKLAYPTRYVIENGELVPVLPYRRVGKLACCNPAYRDATVESRAYFSPSQSMYYVVQERI